MLTAEFGYLIYLGDLQIVLSLCSLQDFCELWHFFDKVVLSTFELLLLKGQSSLLPLYQHLPSPNPLPLQGTSDPYVVLQLNGQTAKSQIKWAWVTLSFSEYAGGPRGTSGQEFPLCMKNNVCHIFHRLQGGNWWAGLLGKYLLHLEIVMFSIAGAVSDLRSM